MMKILIADDDTALLHILRTSLEQEGYNVYTAVNGSDALAMAFQNRPDVVILDVMMPKMDGLETCRKLRDLSTVPIIALSARDSEAVVVDMLNAGADDYLTKPFNLAELKARIEAVLRRAGNQIKTASLVYDDGWLRVDLMSNIVSKGGQEIALSPKELHLLSCLVQNAGQVMSQAQLLREVWGSGYENETGYLALYIRYLRQKIEDDPSQPRYILTRYRVGYYFCGSKFPHEAPE